MVGGLSLLFAANFVDMQYQITVKDVPVTVHSASPRGVFVRTLHENPRLRAPKRAFPAHFVCIMLL